MKRGIIVLLGAAIGVLLCTTPSAATEVMPGIVLAQAGDKADAAPYPDIRATYISFDGPDVLLGVRFWNDIERGDALLNPREYLRVHFSSDLDHASVSLANQNGQLVWQLNSSTDGDLWKDVEVRYQYDSGDALLYLRMPRWILKGSDSMTCDWVVMHGLEFVDHAPDDGAESLRADFPQPPYFSDIPWGSPFFLATNQMFQYGVATGYATSPGQREFRPDAPVWRAQFAQMIVVSLGLAVTEDMDVPFDDLGQDDEATYYPHEYVAAAAAAGITRGTASGVFDPYSSISRAQVISMVMRAMEQGSFVLQDPPANFHTRVPDDDPTHGANIRKAEYNGITSQVTGYGPGWDIWAPATRGEVAQMLISFLIGC